MEGSYAFCKSFNTSCSPLSFVFNLGAGCFQRSTIRQKLNRGDRAGAAKVLLRYNRAGGKVIKGLVNRRMAEFKLFMSNQYATE